MRREAVLCAHVLGLTQDEVVHGRALDEVFGALPFPCLLLDTDLRVLHVTSAMLHAAGRSIDAVVGRDVFEAFPFAEPVDVVEAPGRRAGPGSLSDVAVRTVRDSMVEVVRTGQATSVPLLRYDCPAGVGLSAVV